MKKTNEGFTVVELLVSVALLVIILVPTAVFFTNSFKVQSNTSQKSAITRVGQYIVENFKNKNYLTNDLKNSDKSFSSFLANEIVVTKRRDVVEENEYRFDTDTLESIDNNRKWKIGYEGVEYDVDIHITGFDTSDVSSLDVPDSSACDAYVLMSSSGGFNEVSSSYSTISTYEMGTSFTDPIDGKQYTANYPTIILGEGFGGNDGATLWIKNNGYYDSTKNRQKVIRIIKEFEGALYVYKEGDNFSIQIGQPGDGASASQQKYDELFIGANEADKKENSSELLLDAVMIISKTTDDTIRDTFEFSFPISYDYSK